MFNFVPLIDGANNKIRSTKMPAVLCYTIYVI
jgi:hypothetical protein